LHQVVRDNLHTLYAAIEQGFATPLPAFVKDELEGYVDCGVLSRGFAVLSCSECTERIVVGLSCRGLGFCPSCLGRRMAETAANLVEHVFPTEAPLRQFVLTLPFELRARLAYDGKLLGAVCHAFVDSVLGWYQRHFKVRGLDRGKSGAVTAVQRVSSDLRLNPHFHTLALDGVYVEDEKGELVFHPLPCLTNGDVADILQIAETRILRLLRRQGVIEDAAVNADETLAETEPALAELAVASTLGRVPAGPTLRQKDPIRLRPGQELEHPKGLCAAARGFSLHAATTARADDAVGREALCKYILRPPIARENIQLGSDDLVRLKLKRPFSDGTFALDLDPLSLLVRLATTVPPPHFHTVRYAGVLAAASKWRPRVIPPPKPPTESDHTEHACSTCTAKDQPPTHRSGYRPWRELLMRSFKIDVEHCQSCGARMKLRALVMTSAGVERYLRWLGEPVDPPSLAPARDPPYFKSRVIRRRLGEPAQAELFDAH
jgi:Putative transposase/Transposase zinc-binding domain